jgi:nitric oxide reductase large subunit
MEAKNKQIMVWSSVVVVLIIAIVAIVLFVPMKATAREKAKTPGVVDMSSSEVKAKTPNLSGTKVTVDLSATKASLSKTKVK